MIFSLNWGNLTLELVCQYPMLFKMCRMRIYLPLLNLKLQKLLNNFMILWLENQILRTHLSCISFYWGSIFYNNTSYRIFVCHVPKSLPSPRISTSLYQWSIVSSHIPSTVLRQVCHTHTPFMSSVMKISSPDLLTWAIFYFPILFIYSSYVWEIILYFFDIILTDFIHHVHFSLPSM